MRRFFDRQPTEGAQLDQPREPRIDSFEVRQHQIEDQDRYAGRRGAVNDIVKRHALQVVASFLCRFTSRVIHENPSHHLRSHAEEMGTVLPVDIALFDEQQIRLVNKCGRLQRMPVALTTKLTRRDCAQFAIDKRQQTIQRVWIASTPMIEQSRDVVIWAHSQSGNR